MQDITREILKDYVRACELLPDSLDRPLADRLEILLLNFRSEARLAVALRMKLHEVAGPEVASSIL